MLRIAVDSGPTSSDHSYRGVGTYTRELIRALGNRVEAVDTLKTDLSKFDVVHFTSFNPFFINIPLTKPKGTKFVLTIHDLIPLLYPNNFPSGIKGFINWQINKYLIKRNVDAIITVSQTSKRDIYKYLKYDFDKIFVVYNAPSKKHYPLKNEMKKKIRLKFKLPEHFAFYLGDVNYNKNIPTLIKACELINFPLVMGGKQIYELEKMDLNHAETRHLKGVMESIKRNNILRLGFISDQEASAIYSMADVYVQPSFYEGFGLPIVDAFTCRCPVVSSSTPALYEVGKGGAIFADPNNPNDFADKIKKVTTDKVLRNQLIETGSVIGKNYSWGRSADETMKVYESL